MSLAMRKLYGRWLATWIEKANKHPAYYRDTSFLCHVILNEFKSPSRYLVIEHINAMLAGHMTLRNHIYNTCDFIEPSEWELQAPIHNRFWTLKCRALRNGDLDWGRTLDLVTLGLRKPDEE